MAHYINISLSHLRELNKGRNTKLCPSSKDKLANQEILASRTPPQTIEKRPPLQHRSFYVSVSDKIVEFLTSLSCTGEFLLRCMQEKQCCRHCWLRKACT